MHSMTWGLERFDEDNISPTKKLGGDPVIRIIEFMVNEFTQRELTRESDILDAFAGVGAYISRWTGSPLRLGLSEKHMFGCLIWKLRGEYSQGTSFASKQRPGFPTWSWASRYGNVHCSGNFYECCFDGGRNLCNVDNWAMAYVWMDIYLADTEGALQRLNCCETQTRCIDIARLLQADPIQSLSQYLICTPREPCSMGQLPRIRENTMFFRTFSFTRTIRETGRYFTYWACGKPRSVWDSKGQEIGCVYVDDINYAAYEGEAELLLISLVERIPGPFDDRNPSGFGSDLDRWLQLRVGTQKKPIKENKRRVGYFNVMWVIADEGSPSTKKRIGTGVVLTEFIIGQVKDELETGMVDVFLY